MLRRDKTRGARDGHAQYAFDDLHQWILSLPWVVERPYSLATPGVRAFGVDCEPLGRRQLWLVTGLQQRPESAGLGLAVIVPIDVADELESVGWGRSVVPMPVGHAMVAVDRDAVPGRPELEALVLTAYCCAIA